MDEENNIIDSIVDDASPNKEKDDLYSGKIVSAVNNGITQTKNWIKDTAYDIVNKAMQIGNNMTIIASKASQKLYDVASDIAQNYKNNNSVEQNRLNSGDFFNKGLGMVNAAIETAASYVSMLGDYLGNTFITSTGLGQALVSVVKIIGQSMQEYQDGISETSFGAYMSKTWAGNSSTSFLDYFKNENMKNSGSYKINILKSTPLDSTSARDSLFGSMILGTPYTFNSVSDPNNRVLVNSLVKDCKVVSFTPGMPKYYGSQNLQDKSNNIFNQTTSPNDMLTYLLRNGMDKTFSEKDKRYYTFEAKYKEYFSYLEAMLNPIWIKMGLAQGSDNKTFNIYSFFKIRSGDGDGGIDPSNYQELMEQYNSSIGFYVNPASAVSESISNSQTSIGGELAGNVNSASEEYQRINYITGMGTGTALQGLSRKIAIGLSGAQRIGSYISDNFTTASKWSTAVGGVSAGSNLGRALIKTASKAAWIAGAAADVTRMSATEDFGSVIQQYATTNGMKVVYPELWAESGYSKNINFNLSFISPYGDPLSIFKYVYVPFCALLCLGLPRQAAENGFVSPFFVRADIPGMFTTDLGLISDITWTKGGSNNLWTKDGLPRAIDCTITLTDLYPYLAMTKRISFLSANPSYTVFLDNMAGMCALNDNSEEDPTNEYFKRLVNRISGETDNGNILWNKFNSTKQDASYNVANSTRSSISKGVDMIPWMYNSSLG